MLPLPNETIAANTWTKGRRFHREFVPGSSVEIWSAKCCSAVYFPWNTSKHSEANDIAQCNTRWALTSYKLGYNITPIKLKLLFTAFPVFDLETCVFTITILLLLRFHALANDPSPRPVRRIPTRGTSFLISSVAAKPILVSTRNFREGSSWVVSLSYLINNKTWLYLHRKKQQKKPPVCFKMFQVSIENNQCHFFGMQQLRVAISVKHVC